MQHFERMDQAQKKKVEKEQALNKITGSPKNFSYRCF
jgi:hypothetical protein